MTLVYCCKGWDCPCGGRPIDDGEPARCRDCDEILSDGAVECPECGLTVSAGADDWVTDDDLDRGCAWDGPADAVGGRGYGPTGTVIM